MRLYIANPTRQEQVICYRADFANDGQRLEADRTRFQPARQQSIPPGRQIQLGGDMHLNQINDIIEQLKPFGLIGEVDVPRMGRRVVPYVFQIDRYVSPEALRRVIDHNSGVLVEDGRQRRQKAAVATSDIVQNTIENQFNQAGVEAPPPNPVELGIEQLEQSELGEKTIAEGFRVNPTDDPKVAAPAKGRGSKGRGRRGK